MRVAYVCADPGVPAFGVKGSSVHVQEVLHAFLARGDAVELVCLRRGGRVPDRLAGVVVHEVGNDEAVGRVLAGLDRVDLVYERYSLWGQAGTAHAVRTGVPAVLEVNSPLIEEQCRHRGAIDEAAAEDLLRVICGRASTVVCVSEPVAGWVRRLAPDARLRVVGNGVDTARVRPAAVRPGGQFTVGFVGSFRAWHGLSDLLEAVAAVPDIGLLLVGDGPGLATCRARAAAPDLAGRVELPGPVHAAAVPAQLHRMHVGAAPAPPDAGGYFSPIKVLEYLAAGLPVVASRTGPVEEVVRHGQEGLLVEAGDVGGLASALTRLRDDADLRLACGAAARRTAQLHTWADVLRRSVDQVLPHPAPVGVV